MTPAEDRIAAFDRVRDHDGHRLNRLARLVGRHMPWMAFRHRYGLAVLIAEAEDAANWEWPDDAPVAPPAPPVEGG